MTSEGIAVEKGEYRDFTGWICWGNSEGWVKDASFSLRTGFITWIDWKCGIWQDGIFAESYWNDGTWMDGRFVLGTWSNGTWMKGDWNGGAWKGGTWHDGTWHGGLWFCGKWINGRRLLRRNNSWAWTSTTEPPAL